MILAIATGTLAAAPLLAQGQINSRLAASQPAKWAPALCPIKAGNSKVDKAISALKKSYDAKTPADKAANLAEARQNLVTAITAENQTGNAAAWYYLARTALLRGDAVEADSAFTRAQELVPTCDIDITQYRQNSWANLANAAIEFQKNDQIDSAMALFRDASIMFRGLPHVYSNMGVVYANSGREDSAAVYFAKALEIAEKDTALTEDRNTAALNLAIMLSRSNQHDRSIAVLRKYLTWKPGDIDAQKVLAASFRASGKADSADALESAMAAELAKVDFDSLETPDLMSVGVAAFNKQRYPEAEAAFSRAVKRNPVSRDALYNLANTYFALKDNAKLVEYSTKLLELEPMNVDALRLLAQGQRGLNQEAEVIKTATRLVMMPFTIEITSFSLNAQRAILSADAVGRSPTDAAGKPIKTEPQTLVVEFVNLSGAPVATKEITVPVLKDGERHTIRLEGAGQGIMGWRYKAKS
jgi:tetratricopeptide (TPR) repeat protein